MIEIKSLIGIMLSFRVIRLVISTNKQNTEGTCLLSVIKKHKMEETGPT